jgi:peroxiredoxin Q/BCP
MSDLQVGHKAPSFKTKDQTGQLLQLKDFIGKKVVLYFYPKDLTATCTVQACNLRDHYKALQKKGYVVLGVSADEKEMHQKFIQKNQLPFPLLMDTDHQLATAYGVWGEKKMYGRTYWGIHRTTFIIDEKGKIAHIITKPKSSVHAQEILSL